MGKKTVKHHRIKKHHRKHKKNSKFSLFKHKIADVFKEIVEAPPEPQAEVKEEVKTEVKQEVKEEPKEVEREESNPLRNEVLQNLNSAVSRWKETGDVGLHLEPPAPTFGNKVKAFWSRIKTKTPVPKKSDGTPAVSVKEEWKEVVEKVKSVNSSSERKEIEKLYKELSGR
jgi:hypothetical protein